MCSDMCTNRRYVTNKTTGARVLVDCGRCAACLQDKANRLTNKIRLNYSPNKSVYFLTLTYDRISCPFVLDEDLYNRRAGDEIPVYREYRIKRSRLGSRNKRVYERTKIGSIEYSGYGLNDGFSSKFKPIHHLKHRPWTGVCFYKDLQNFMKRLRINLDRNYGFKDKIEFFGCSEIGPKTKRPHFHLLLFFPRGTSFEEIIRPAVIKSWPYASKYRTSRGLEVPRQDCSSYVASYVNCFTTISAFLRENCPPKRSFSKFFGRKSGLCSLWNILDCTDKVDFSYSAVSSSFKGTSFLAAMPSRYISYYFPKIKGFSRLSDDALSVIASHNFRLFDYSAREVGYNNNSEVHDTADNYKKVALGYSRFSADYSSAFGVVPDTNTYAFYWRRVWSSYYAFLHRLYHVRCDDLQIPYTMRYENLQDIYFGCVSAGGFDDCHLSLEDLVYDDFPHVKSRNQSLEYYFNKRDKSKKINNVLYDAQGFNI